MFTRRSITQKKIWSNHWNFCPKSLRQSKQLLHGFFIGSFLMLLDIWTNFSELINLDSLTFQVIKNFLLYWELGRKRLNSNPLNTHPIKWSNKFKQFVGKLPTNCLNVFDHFVGLALKGLIWMNTYRYTSKCM